MKDSCLVLFALLCTIIYGYRSRKNMAPMALTFAFFIGCGFMGLSVRELVAYLPVQIMFNIFAITFFFGFALSNGTLTVIVDKILYRAHNHAYITLPVLFLVSFFVALLGAGIYASAFMAPIAFKAAEETRAKPALAYVAVACGTSAGSNFVSSAGGTVVLGMIRDTPYSKLAYAITLRGFLWSAFIAAVCFIAAYLLMGGWKGENPSIKAEQASLTALQKKNAILILIVASLSILPGAFASFLSFPWLDRLAGFCDTGMLMIAGGGVASLLGLGDDREILVRRVPWGTIVMLGGISVLIGVGKSAGMVEVLAGLVSGGIPTILIAPVLAVSAGLMSMFSSAVSVVIPALFPLVPQLAAGSGASASLLYACIFVAATATGASPLSTNGSMVLGGCDREQVRNRLFYQIIPLPFVLLILVVVISLLLK